MGSATVNNNKENRFAVSFRPLDYLKKVGKLYPKAWEHVDAMRAGRGKSVYWPDWCFLPVVGFSSIVSATLKVKELSQKDAPRVFCLAAVGTWRVTQGIYQFDPDVYDAVRQTPLTKDIPCSILYRIPEWCVYIVTPGLEWGNIKVHGAWAHLEWEMDTGTNRLQFVLDAEGGLLPISLHLGDWSLDEAIDRAITEAVEGKDITSFDVTTFNSVLGQRLGVLDSSLAVVDTVVSMYLPVVRPLLALLLYICSQNSEIGDPSKRPGNPKSKVVRGLARTFQAERATVWGVGVRLGSALRRAYQADRQAEGGTHAGPRPHVRRAHWHGFWTGPLESSERKFDLRWLPPIAVNVDDSKVLPAVMHPVR